MEVKYLESANVHLLVRALLLAQPEFPVIQPRKVAKIPTRNGGSINFNYADLADVLLAVQPVLRKHHLLLTHPHGMVVAPTGGVAVTSRVLHESGQWMAAVMVHPLEPDAKAMGALTTYYRRYTTCALLGISPDEDIDAPDRMEEQLAARERKRQQQKSALTHKAEDEDQSKDQTKPPAPQWMEEKVIVDHEIVLRDANTVTDLLQAWKIAYRACKNGKDPCTARLREVYEANPLSKRLKTMQQQQGAR